MKLISLLLIATLLFATSLIITTALEENSQQIEITLAGQTPSVVNPGDDITLQIRIENKGGAEANNIELSLDLPEGIELTRQISQGTNDLCGGCVKEYVVYLKSSTLSGSGQYPLRAMVSTEAGTYTKEIFLTFVGGANLILREYSFEEVIDTNHPFESNLTFTNIGTGSAQTVKITSNSANLILLDRSAIIIDEIKPKENATVNVRFSLSKKVTPDTHRFELLAEFKNENGENQQQVLHLGIPVSNKAKLNIQNVKSDAQVIRQRDDVELLLRVENIGNGRAENVKVIFETPLEGRTTAYVGNLGPNEDAPAVIYLHANKLGNVHSNITLHYTDDTGEHIKKEEFILTIKPNYVFLGMIIIPIGLIIGLAYYRKKKISEFLYHKKLLQITNNQIDSANKNLNSGREKPPSEVLRKK